MQVCPQLRKTEKETRKRYNAAFADNWKLRATKLALHTSHTRTAAEQSSLSVETVHRVPIRQRYPEEMRKNVQYTKA